MPEQQNNATEQTTDQQAPRLFSCQKNNPFSCLIRKALDTGITGKLLGMLIVSLLGFTLILAQNTYTLHTIKKLTDNIKDENIPQYKASQYILRSLNGFKISLIHLLNQKNVTADDKNILANRQRLETLERIVLAMKDGGTIMDVAKISQKTMDIITIAPTRSPEMTILVNKIIAEFTALDTNFNGLVYSLAQQPDSAAANTYNEKIVGNLDELHNLVTDLAIAVNNSYNHNLKETATAITDSQLKLYLTSSIIAAILFIGTILYILLIVVPLKDILAKIKQIAKEEGTLSQRIEVPTHDEIGQLAKELNTLVDNIFSLNTFKAVIEEEETTTEVNKRLANLLQDRYNFKDLFVYEISGSKNTMNVAFASAHENICSPDILDDCNYCRAKRTGHPISSIEYPAICKKFPHGDRLEHHCIPMIANGRAVGIVQFLLDKNCPPSEKNIFEKNIGRASRYIKEATPVLDAKRFASALQETTLKDPMTDLYNRRFLETYTETLVANTMRRASKLGILMCDMDFFKEVNDTHGHETGDVVLIKTADVLKSCVRASDTVIRYGGEEFLILLTDVHGRTEVAELAERIRSTMEQTIINIPDGTLKKTLSIGYSLFPDDTQGLWEAIKFADVALYRAKDSGRNKAIGFQSEMWAGDKY